MRLASVIGLALVASSALGAEESAPPPPVPPAAGLPPIKTPTWSLGAGLSFTAPLSGLSITGSQFTPVLSAERVFSPRFALGLGVEASVYLISASNPALSSLTGTVGLGVSPRFIVTNPDAPVSFTIFATLFGSYGSLPGSAETGFAVITGSSAGLAGGVAFELRLMERLSVRAQASLARVTVSSVATRFPSGFGTAGQLVLGASFLLSPSLELRLYF